MKIKELLKQNKQAYGIWCIMPSPEAVNTLCKAGLDFVLLDFEHSPLSFETAQNMINAANAEGSSAIARVSRLDEAEILKALDIGAEGVIVPHIQTPQDMQKVVACAKYPPLGQRGYSPYTKAGGYSVREGYIKQANENFIGIIIEDKTGIDNLLEIVKNPHLDMVYIGAYDISISLGYPGQINHPEVKKVIESCIKICLAAGKQCGCMFHTADDLNHFIKLGVNFLVYKVDTLLLWESLGIVREAKSAK